MIDTEIDSENSPTNVVVIKPQQESEICSDSSYDSTMQENLFFTTDEKYFVFTKSESVKIEFPKNNIYNVRAYDGLIEKIHMTGVKLDKKCFLMDRRENLLSSIINKDTNESMFDINKRKKGGALDHYINFCSAIYGKNPMGNQENKAKLILRNKYLLCEKFGYIKLRIPDATPKVKEIVLEGLFETNGDDIWKQKLKKYKLIPNEKFLYFKDLVKEIEFTHEDKFTMYIRIEDQLYGPFESKESKESEDCMDCHMIKFRFSGWNDTKFKNLPKKVQDTAINIKFESFSVSSDVENLHTSVSYYEYYDIKTHKKLSGNELINYKTKTSFA